MGWMSQAMHEPGQLLQQALSQTISAGKTAVPATFFLLVLFFFEVQRTGCQQRASPAICQPCLPSLSAGKLPCPQCSIHFQGAHRNLGC